MIWLIFAHFIGDWALQSERIAKEKANYWFVMFAHCVIWTGCICIALEYLGVLNGWKIMFLFFGHYICDYWKCRVYSKVPFCEQRTLKHLYIDQMFHLAQVLAVGF